MLAAFDGRDQLSLLCPLTIYACCSKSVREAI
jgi:hypothetical protein